MAATVTERTAALGFSNYRVWEISGIDWAEDSAETVEWAFVWSDAQAGGVPLIVTAVYKSAGESPVAVSVAPPTVFVAGNSLGGSFAVVIPRNNGFLAGTTVWVTAQLASHSMVR